MVPELLSLSWRILEVDKLTGVVHAVWFRQMFAWSVQFFWRQFFDIFALNTKQSWLQEIVNVGWFVILTSNAEQMLTQVPRSENAWVFEIHQKHKLFHTSTAYMRQRDRYARERERERNIPCTWLCWNNRLRNLKNSHVQHTVYMIYNQSITAWLYMHVYIYIYDT